MDTEDKQVRSGPGWIDVEDVEKDRSGRARVYLPLSMSARILGLGVLLVAIFAVSTNTAINHLALGDRNVTEESGFGLDFTARIVGNTSDPASPILVELVCKNIRQTENAMVSPFPEWNFNPVFLLRAPDNQLFYSWNSRYGPPPTQQRAILVPGQEISKVFDLFNLPSTGWWVEEGWTATSQWHRGPDVFTEPGEYKLTAIYHPFFHQFFTNRTRASISMNVTLTFNRPKAPSIAHLGPSNLLFLSADLGSTVLEAGSGPYEAIGGVFDSYDLVILDNVPPEWIMNATEAFRRAVVDRGLRIVIFGGPNSLGGNGTYSSWCDGPLGKLLPVECLGTYREIPPGYRILKLGPLKASAREEAFQGLDTSTLNTIRHLNPCYMRPGSYPLYAVEWQGREPEFLLVEWEVGKGDVIVCSASLEEILAWGGGRDLVSRIIKAALLPG